MDTAANPVTESAPVAPAAVEQPAAETVETDLSKLNETEYSTWRQTGELPKRAASPKKEGSDPSSEAGKKPAESAPASEAGKPQESSKRDNAETRLQEILSDLKRAGLSPAELKTFKREAAAPASKPADPAPAKQPEIKVEPPASLQEPKEPRIEDYEATDAGWKKYEADVRKYNKDYAEYTAKKLFADFQRQQVEAQQTARLTQELAQGRQIYKDFDEKATPVLQTFMTDQQIHPLVKEVVGSSAVFPHLIYVIGGDSARMEQLVQDAKTNPIKALKTVAVLENLVMEELEKAKSGKANEGPQRGEDGKFKAPEKKVSAAPPPPSEAPGKGEPPVDEAEEALKSGNLTRYNEIMNAQDLKRGRR